MVCELPFIRLAFLWQFDYGLGWRDQRLSPTQGGYMSLQSRIDSLKNRHHALDARVSEEDHRPRPDPDALIRLKGEKLRLKDEMERLAQRG
jgi:hypothetical protein